LAPRHPRRKGERARVLPAQTPGSTVVDCRRIPSQRSKDPRVQYHGVDGDAGVRPRGQRGYEYWQRGRPWGL
jgi:hypothetical protein